MKYLARISYDGSQFEGFQRLKNGKGVQNELERVLSKIACCPVQICGAGRTDALVHALDQCIHFELNQDFDEDKLLYMLNRNLDEAIAVLKIQKVSDDFHARYDVKEKTYLYKIYLGKKNPFVQNYAYSIYQTLDVELMKQCASLFIGEHDFQNFVCGKRTNYQANIFNMTVSKKDDYLYIEVNGKGFYRYMVRCLVGAMIQVGLGKVSLEDVYDALYHPEVEKRFMVAPPQGLYLKCISYSVI